jgi:hypothetical protein
MSVSASPSRRPQRVLPLFEFGFACVSPLRAGFLLFVVICALSGCVTSTPIEDYTLARAAYDSAKDAEALRYAPALWYNAEQAYREGQRAYKERRYDDAEQEFKKARIAAEKAENAARVARHNAGDL